MQPKRESDSDLELWKFDGVHSSETQKRIKHFIADAEKEFDSLELKITQPQSALNGLLLQRTTVRCAISPFEKVPNEILSEIFAHCTHSWMEYDITLPPRRLDPGSLWPLVHVCSQWRRVFWNTPEAWSRIRCEGSSYYAYEPILYNILSNSTGLVDLSLAYADDSKILNVICQFPKRFKRLELEWYQLYQLCYLLGPLDHTFVSLENLTVNIWKVKEPNYHLFRKAILAPKLQTISFRGCRTGYLQYLLPLLPWAQIVDLKLRCDLPSSTVHSILSKCNSIVTCEAHIIQETLRPATRHEDIALHKLKSLSLRLQGGCDINHFLQPFILTAIEELNISTNKCPWSEVIELVQRSSCHLKRIWIEKRGYCRLQEFIDLTPLFRFTPSLVELHVNEPFMILLPSTFKHIISDGLVPHIKSLKCYVFPEGAHAFLDLMEYYDLRGPSNGIQLADINYKTVPSNNQDRGEPCDRFNSLVSKYKADGRSIRMLKRMY